MKIGSGSDINCTYASKLLMEQILSPADFVPPDIAEIVHTDIIR